VFATCLETTREGVQEVLRLQAKRGFVGVVFADLAIVDLVELDIGEYWVVEEPMLQTISLSCA
jgi:hypothetical protein